MDLLDNRSGQRQKRYQATWIYGIYEVEGRRIKSTQGVSDLDDGRYTIYVDHKRIIMAKGEVFRVEYFIEEVEKHVEEEVLKRLDKSGFIVAGEIKEVITSKGLIDTGLYRASINHEMIPKKLTVRIGSPIGNLQNPSEDPPYPLYLELGTAAREGNRGIPAHRPMQTGLANSKSRVQAVWR